MSDPTTGDPGRIMALVHLAGDLAEVAAEEAILLHHRRAFAGQVWRTKQECRMCREQAEEAVMTLADRVPAMAAVYAFLAARARLGRVAAAHELRMATEAELDEAEAQAGDASDHVWAVIYPNTKKVVIDSTTQTEKEPS